MRTPRLWIPVAVLAIAGCAASRAEVRRKPAVAKAAVANATPPAPALPTLSEALARAGAAHEPLLLDFSTAWCSACKIFDRALVPDPSVAYALKKTVFLTYDAEHAPGAAVAQHFGIAAFPTFLLLDDKGRVVWHREGIANSPALFADDLIDGLGRALPADAIQALAAHPTGADPLLIAAWDVHHGKVAAAETVLQAASVGPGGDATTRAGADAIAPRALQALQALQTGQRIRAALEDSELALITRFPGSSAGWFALAELLHFADPHAPKVVSAARTVLAAQSKQASALNELAYEFIYAGLPKLAVKAAKAQVALKPGDYNAYDTLGEALGAAGQTAAAARAGARAVALSQKVKLPHGIAAQLRADAARFAKGTPSPIVPAMQAMTTRIRAALARVDLETLLTANAAGWHPPPQRRFDLAVNDRLADAGQACKSLAGSLHVAWVRLVVPKNGGPPSLAKVIEPGASKDLATCLEKKLAQAHFPAPGGYFAGQPATLTRPLPLRL